MMAKAAALLVIITFAHYIVGRYMRQITFVGSYSAEEKTVPAKLVIAETPECNFQNDTVSCCLSIIYNGHNAPNCVTLKMENYKPVAIVSLYGEELLRGNFSIGEQCINDYNTEVPACLEVYYIQVNKDGTTDVCFFVKVLFELNLNFGCIKYDNETFLMRHKTALRPDIIRGVAFGNGISKDFI